MTSSEARNYFTFLKDDPDEVGTNKQMPRTCCIEFYDDGKTSSFGDLDIGNLISYLDSEGIDFFGILHDRCVVTSEDKKKEYYANIPLGTLKKAHYHFYLHFNKQIKMTSFCRQTGVAPKGIIVPRGTASQNLVYFLHQDEKSCKLGKTRYELNEILTSYTETQIEDLYNSDETDNSQIIDQLALVAIGTLSYYEFLKLHPNLLYKSSSLLAIVRELRPFGKNSNSNEVAQ